jgi:short-subunit dehydrogenase
LLDYFLFEARININGLCLVALAYNVVNLQRMKDTPLAWIVGGSGGIGFVCAQALAHEGYRLALSGRDEAALQAASGTLTADSHNRLSVHEVLLVPCDVSVEVNVKDAYRKIVKHFGRAPDVLINSAGISPWSTFTETSTAEFDEVIAINTRGMFLTSREVLADMYARKSGAIVQMLSVAALKGYKNGAAYVASKFASLGFTNALREEAREHGVRVIAVFPGATETELWSEHQREKYRKRMMQPSDIADAVVAALKAPSRALVEEIVLRPISGDL